MKQLDIIVTLVVAVVLSVAIGLFANRWQKTKEAAVVGEQRGGIMESTHVGVQRSAVIDQQQEAYNRGLADAC